jgi:hypothetical protein
MLLDIGFTVLTPWPLKLIVDYVWPGQPVPDAASWIGLLPGGNGAIVLLAWLALTTLPAVCSSNIHIPKQYEQSLE